MAYGEQVNDVSESQERTGSPKHPGLTHDQFLQYAEMSSREPQWRAMSDRACDYYDGNQISSEDRQIAEQRGLPDITANLIAPIINVILGMEEKSRLDWRVAADSSSNQDVAEGLSQLLKEAERETNADRVRSDCYAGQIKPGIAWAEVGRTSDPFARCKYRVETVHRREMWWDWRDTTPDLSKSTWIIRKRVYDVNHFAAFFPGREQLIRGYARGGMAEVALTQHESLDLSQSINQERSFGLANLEFRDPYAMTVTPYEVSYRCWSRGYVLTLPDGRTVELDLKNQLHKALLADGRIKPVEAVYSKIYRSLWLGPVKLMDSEYRHSRWPYIPFFGYREDLTGVPYGAVRPMIPLQDEVNARRNKLMHLLSSKCVMMDSDALDQEINSISDMLASIASANSFVALNPLRTNRDANAFRVASNGELAPQQVAVMEEAKQAMQQVVGVFNATLGREQSSQSGVAIAGLVEQSTTALGEINGNYRYSSQLLGQALLDEIRYERRGQPVQVEVGERAAKRIIVLNNPVQDPQTGIQLLDNNTESTRTKVALQEVPSTPAYRQQQLQMVTQVISGAAPPLQAALFPFLLEMTDLGNRYEMADSVRQAIGSPPPATEEEKQQRAQAAQQQAQVAQQIQAQVLDAQLRKTAAEALEAEAKAKQAALEVELKAIELKERQVGLLRGDDKDRREQQTHDLTAIRAAREMTTNAQKGA